MAANPLRSESWHSFLESSLLEELRLHLQLGNLPAASCIWIRHHVRKEERGRRGGRGCVWFKPEDMNQYAVEMTARHTP